MAVVHGYIFAHGFATMGRIELRAMSQAPDESLIGGGERRAPCFGRDYWFIFWASFLLNCSDNLFVLFPAYIAELGASPSIIGAVLGVGSLSALATRPGATYSIARRGRRWTSAWFLILNAVAVVLYLPVRAIGAGLWVVRLLNGAFEGTARVALFAMVYERLPPGRRGYAMAIFSLSSIIPAAFAPMAGEALVRWAGYFAFFIACAIALVAAAGVVMGADETVAGGGLKRAASHGRAAYVELFRDRRLMPLWAAAAAFAIALTARFSFITPFAYSHGMASVGWYFLLCSGVAALARVAGSRVLDRVGLDRALVPALGVLAVGTAMIAGIPVAGIVAAAAVVGGLGQGYAYPAISALIIARTPAEAAGYSSSIYNSIFDAIGIIGPYLLGLCAQGVGYRWMFVVAGAVALAGASLPLGVREPAQD